MAAKLSRRTFLEGVGLGLAVLPAFPGDHARAAGCPRRLLMVLQSEGVIQRAFWPTGGNGNDLGGMTLPEITAPLEPWKAKLSFLSGVEMRNFTEYPGHGGGHENYSLTFTGAKGNPSAYKDPRWEPWEAATPTIDHHIATGLAGKPGIPSLQALRLGVQIERQGSYQAQKRCFYRADRQPYSPQDSPFKVFDELFAGRVAGAPVMDQLRAEKRSMLDFVGRDVERFAARLGRAYQQETAAHLASVRALEGRLSPAGAAVPACDGKGPAQLDLAANESYPGILDIQLDLAVAALRCDVTRIVTVQVNNANGEKVVFSWVKGVNQTPMEYGRRDHHDLAHRPGTNQRDKILVDQWYMAKLAELMKRLDTARDCDGASLLDSTALLWANHMGDGGAHSSKALPWILAGSAGGYFKPGRVVKVDGPTNGVLIALSNAMGVPTQTFGDARYGGEATALRG